LGKYLCNRDACERGREERKREREEERERE
jgi:hypothetical protein